MPWLREYHGPSQTTLDNGVHWAMTTSKISKIVYKFMTYPPPADNPHALRNSFVCLKICIPFHRPRIDRICWVCGLWLRLRVIWVVTVQFPCFCCMGYQLWWRRVAMKRFVPLNELCEASFHRKGTEEHKNIPLFLLSIWPPLIAPDPNAFWSIQVLKWDQELAQ